MNLRKKIAVYRKDPSRKPHLITLYEVIRCLLKEGECSYYFSNLLYKKDASNYLDYIGNKKSLRIRKEVFKLDGILNDKKLFQKFVQENNIAGPTCLAYIENGHLDTGSTPIKIRTQEMLLSLLGTLAEDCASSNSIFLKPTNGIGGGGAYKFTKGKMLMGENVANLFTDLQKNNYIVQEAVVQHETMNRLNRSSLNTVRILTYKKPSGEVVIASALSRMGCGGAHVDNASCGGIFVPIDTANARLESYGYSFITAGGLSYTAHPDNGLIFEGFEIPYFHQSLELVRHAASYFENSIVGWDVAITETGPILIEGNYNPHLTGTQIACRGFRKHPVYKELLKEYM